MSFYRTVTLLGAWTAGLNFFGVTSIPWWLSLCAVAVLCGLKNLHDNTKDVRRRMSRSSAFFWIDA